MEELLTIKDLIKVLQVTEQTVQRLVLRKKIPFCKINRMLRFRPSEIDRWIDSGQFTPVVPVKLGQDLFEETKLEDGTLND